MKPNLDKTIRSGSPEFTYVTAAATLTPQQLNVLATIPASGSFNITLPPPPDVAGQIICVEVIADSGGTSVVVIDDDKTSDPYTSTAITAADGYCVLYCNGYRYIELAFSAT